MPAPYWIPITTTDSWSSIRRASRRRPSYVSSWEDTSCSSSARNKATQRSEAADIKQNIKMEGALTHDVGLGISNRCLRSGRLPLRGGEGHLDGVEAEF